MDNYYYCTILLYFFRVVDHFIVRRQLLFFQVETLLHIQ